MALRFVERRRAFLSMQARQYSTRIESALLTPEGGAAAALDVAPGLAVIAGGNGAGKSTLLGALWRSTTGAPLDDLRVPALPQWLRSVEVSGFAGGEPWSAQHADHGSVADSDFRGTAAYINPSQDTDGFLSRLQTDANVADLLEGVDPSRLDDELVERVSYVLRREYDSVEVFEITDVMEGSDEPLPYFRASSMGVSYDVMQMGRGELCLIYLMWRLDQLEDDSLVFLEEPESHLAFLSQRRMVEVLSIDAASRGISLVVSSHSPDFFAGLPDGSVSLVSTIPQLEIDSRLATAVVADHLGHPWSCSAILVVEDFVAGQFLSAILSTMGSLVTRVAIVSVGGEAEARRLADGATAITPGAPAFLAVLDGDQRGPATDSVGFLPGTAAPEVVMRSALSLWQRGERPEWECPPPGDAELRRTLAELGGLEDHDWLSGLGARLGGTAAAVRMAVSLLALDPSFSQQSSALVEWLASRLPEDR